ncbi:MAG TPA: hypothetical protein VMT42_02825 [candidate division Zixibacteria bacterium]|nr:hypothetical protein [candidate division Zixibacteria bacterium]
MSQSNITTNNTNGEPGFEKAASQVYAATLRHNITTDVKKKRRGGTVHHWILYSNIMIDLNSKRGGDPNS